MADTEPARSPVCSILERVRQLRTTILDSIKTFTFVIIKLTEEDTADRRVQEADADLDHVVILGLEAAQGSQVAHLVGGGVDPSPGGGHLAHLPPHHLVELGRPRHFLAPLRVVLGCLGLLDPGNFEAFVDQDIGVPGTTIIFSFTFTWTLTELTVGMNSPEIRNERSACWA